MHIAPEIMRGAGQERAEHQHDKAAYGDMQEKQPPIRLASNNIASKLFLGYRDVIPDGQQILANGKA